MRPGNEFLDMKDLERSKVLAVKIISKFRLEIKMTHEKKQPQQQQKSNGITESLPANGTEKKKIKKKK